MLEVTNLHVTIGDHHILRGVDLEAHAGSITAVMGPSGCGKTTLLRAVAGLQATDTGTISWMGNPLDGLRPDQRHVGLMFQDHALFPHRTVAGNVGFGLEMQRSRSTELTQRVERALNLVDMDGLGDRTIDRLSGGEQQRVALARALAPEPDFLMLDEPLGSLDRTLREQLLTDMRSLFSGLGITVLYVTHDRDEVFTIADDLVVMDLGRIEGGGPAEAMWSDPGTVFVARFLGHQNLLTVDVRDGRCQIGEMQVAPEGIEDGTRIVVVPGEAIRHDRNGAVLVKVEAGSFRAGIHTATGVLGNGQSLTFTGGPFAPGATVRVSIDPDRVVAVDE
jgi:thiamine transport system ATP-binding protein